MVKYISKCPCGDDICADWHVNGIAAVQGVKFSRSQAAMVAQLLNDMEKPAYYSAWAVCVNEDLADYGSESIALCRWGGEATFEDACREVRSAAQFGENSDYVIQMRREHGDAQTYDVIPRAAWSAEAAQKQFVIA